MKPASFEYFDPRTVEEAVSLLREHGEEAKILAGGQSLMPLLNMRMARPEALIDLSRVAGLEYIRESDGVLAIGDALIGGRQPIDRREAEGHRRDHKGRRRDLVDAGQEPIAVGPLEQDDRASGRAGGQQ